MTDPELASSCLGPTRGEPLTKTIYIVKLPLFNNFGGHSNVRYSPDKIKKRAPNSNEKPKEPQGVRITLSVCGCYKQERIIFVTVKAECVARILGITTQDLECAAVTAVFTGKSQVVACYKQRDVAEDKLAQLEAEAPFIARSCHSFQIANEE